MVINGLVWMGEEAMQQIEEKLEEGFTCVKLKIGAIDFDELRLLRFIREHFSPEQVEIQMLTVLLMKRSFNSTI
jgi:L-alanine-DL-glutamate epimerase-like enolase superfamily enzyme